MYFVDEAEHGLYLSTYVTIEGKTNRNFYSRATKLLDIKNRFEQGKRPQVSVIVC